MPSEHLTSSGRQNIRAFSLVEILVVMAIVASLTLISMPLVSQVVSSLDLSRSAQSLENGLQLSRQHAVMAGDPVQFCLYKTEEGYCAFQAYLREDTGAWKPIMNVGKLPQTMIINDQLSGGYSTLLQFTVPLTSSEIQRVKSLKVVEGRSFQFRGNGSTDLYAIDGPTSWHLTIHRRAEPVINGLPKNFITLKVNALTGTVKVFQP